MALKYTETDILLGLWFCWPYIPATPNSHSLKRRTGMRTGKYALGIYRRRARMRLQFSFARTMDEMRT